MTRRHRDKKSGDGPGSEGPEQPERPDTGIKRTPTQWGAWAVVASFFVTAPLFKVHVSQEWAAGLLAFETPLVVGVSVKAAITRRRIH
jgi:hypothetical protein